jgi:hypothetical protein
MNTLVWATSVAAALAASVSHAQAQPGSLETAQPKIEKPAVKSAPAVDSRNTRSTKTQTPRVRDRLVAQRKEEAKRHTKKNGAHADAPITIAQSLVASPTTSPNANLQIKSPIERTTPSFVRDPYAYASPRAAASLVIVPTTIDSHVMQNLREPLTPEPVEMGDRPGRGTSMCSEGKIRRFGDIDSKTLAQSLPDFNVVRPRNVCLRKRSLIADYSFK